MSNSNTNQKSTLDKVIEVIQEPATIAAVLQVLIIAKMFFDDDKK